MTGSTSLGVDGVLSPRLERQAGVRIVDRSSSRATSMLAIDILVMSFTLELARAIPLPKTDGLDG